MESDTSFDYTQNILNDNTIPRKPWHDYGSRNRWETLAIVKHSVDPKLGSCEIVSTSSLSSLYSFQLSH